MNQRPTLCTPRTKNVDLGHALFSFRTPLRFVQRVLNLMNFLQWAGVSLKCSIYVFFRNISCSYDSLCACLTKFVPFLWTKMCQSTAFLQQGTSRAKVLESVFIFYNFLWLLDLFQQARSESVWQGVFINYSLTVRQYNFQHTEHWQ